MLGIGRKIKGVAQRIRVANKPKIFCIGCNKTGTTSLKAAMEELGFTFGRQRDAEMLLDDWAARDFNSIIDYCRGAEAFQDVPFSLPDTFKVMDQTFPGSRFILSVRDSPEQWYSSITKFHSKIWGNGSTPPTREELQNADYIYKGHPWHANRLIFNSPEDEPYHRETLLEFYEGHNRSVMEYFADRKGDLLVINTAKSEDYQRLCDFLGAEAARDAFPWENKT